MKLKPNWYYKQSAVIPYRYNDDKLEVLLITSRKKKKWIIPKGIIEIGLTPQESAIKEALEEAGVTGRVGIEEIGKYNYEKWGGVCGVKVYPLLVKKELSKWEEDDIRKRKWFSIENAIKKVEKKELSKILSLFESGVNEE